MPQFDITTYYSQIFWLIVTFSLLYIFACKFIIPKAKEVLNNRQFYIEENIANADKLALEVEKLNEYYNAEITKISTEIDKSKKEKIAFLEEEFSIKKNNLDENLRKLINQNLEDMKLVAENFKNNKLEASVKLAASIIEKITGINADINLLKNIKVK